LRLKFERLTPADWIGFPKPSPLIGG